MDQKAVLLKISAEIRTARGRCAFEKRAQRGRLEGGGEVQYRFRNDAPCARPLVARGVVIFGFSDVCVCRSDRVRKDTKCVIVFSDTPHACWGCVRDVLLPHPLTVPARNGVTCVCTRVYVCDLLFPHACG